MPAPSNPIRFAELVEQKPLNAAEEDFKTCMQQGGVCDFGNIVPDVGNETNTIRADLIGFFARGGDETCRVRGNIIYLQGAWIPGFLDLAHIPSSYSLVLRKCHFADSIIMPHSAFHFLNLSGSLLKGELVGDGVKVTSDMLMGEGFTSESEVRLCGAHIGGNVSCYGGKFKAEEGRNNALNAAGIKVNGGFAMGEGFVAEGEVCLIGADIGGDLSCNKGQFKNAKGVAINSDKIKVKGGVHIGEGLYAEGEMRLIGADIGAGLHCDGGRFVNKGREAFCADNMKVSGSVFMRKGFCADGEMQFLGTTISGDWYCSGAVFQNEEGKAIVADRVRVGGNLHMQDGFVAKGEVRLSGAHIGGVFSCQGGAFDNKKGEVIPALGTNAALVAQGIQVDGSLLLDSGFRAAGAVVLHNAKIGDSVFCDGFFINENNTALVIDDATIGSDLSLRKISAQGAVQLIRADIGGQLHFGGEVYGNVIAESARIGNSLLWRNMRGKGLCNLSFASADVFDYDEMSMRGFEFILDGFSYKRFAKRESAAFRLKWLESRPTKNGFSPQPFEQAAKVLFAMGHRGDAREVLYEMEKRRTEDEYTKLSGWRKHRQRALRWVWEKATGYNHLVRQMLKTSAGIIVASALLFGVADYGGYIVPHQPVVLASSQYKNAITGMPQTEAECKCSEAPRPTEVVECLFSNYPRFNPLSFSVDIFVPLFSLRQEGYWYPQADANVLSVIRWFVLVWYWFVVIAGWVLTSIFALTITGIWQRQQAGG